MKRLLLAALLASGLASQTASAEVRTFDFSAKLYRTIFNYDASVTSAPGPVEGSTASVGETITGRFSFDDAGVNWTDGSSGTHDAISFNLKFADGTIVDFANADWFHSSFGGQSSFGIASPDFGAGPEGVWSIFSFSNWGGMFFDIKNGGPHYTFIEWARPGVDVRAAGVVNSLTEVPTSPVPEPSTYAMLLVGAAVAAGAARRRSTRKVG